MIKKALVPVVVAFIIITILLLSLKNNLEAKGVDAYVVMGGNLVLFMASSLSIFMYAKALKNQNAFGFVRNVYSGFILKFFILIAAVIIYLFTAKEVNKPALFICMGLYFIYTFVGTRTVLKKQQVP